MTMPEQLSIQSAREAQDGPPRRTKVLAVLAALACAGCCAVPLLVPLGVLTSAGVATATTDLLVVSAVLSGVAGLFWFHHYRRTRRGAGHACSGDGCSC